MQCEENLFKSNERSEVSYIGLADFFLLVFCSGKSLKRLLHLGTTLFLSSIEIHLLKMT